jgi:hypothetical protein
LRLFAAVHPARLPSTQRIGEISEILEGTRSRLARDSRYHGLDTRGVTMRVAFVTPEYVTEEPGRQARRLSAAHGGGARGARPLAEIRAEPRGQWDARDGWPSSTVLAEVAAPRARRAAHSRLAARDGADLVFVDAFALASGAAPP